MKEEGAEEKQSKKGSKRKLLFFIVLFILAYMFIFRPLVVAYCQKQEEKSASVFISPFGDTGRHFINSFAAEEKSQGYNNCLYQLDPIQNLKVIILGNK